MKEKNLNKKGILIVLAVLFILVIPAVAIVLSASWLGRTWVRPEAVEEKGVEHLAPSQILVDKMKYKDEFLVIRGQVVPEAAVCERKVCPEYDPCCGCKGERDLIIVDSGTSSIGQSPGRLRLLTPAKESLCQRKKNSCEYDCSDWRLREIYEVRGVFRATPPPAGLKIYLDYYFEVQEKELVKTLGIVERIRALFNDLRNLVSGTKTGGYYILH